MAAAAFIAFPGMAARKIEQRGSAVWPNANHFRFAHPGGVPAGQPVWADVTLPAGFFPDSVRVLGLGTKPLPAKTDWRTPQARVSWISDNSSSYLFISTPEKLAKRRGCPKPQA